MKHIHKIIEVSEMELGEIAQTGKFRTRDEVDMVYKLMDIIKDGYCIMDMESGESSYDGGSYGYDDMSYRGRRRDSMGRYSRDGSYRGYSRDYSEDRGEFAERLQNLMEHAPDKDTRQGLKHMLDQMQG